MAYTEFLAKRDEQRLLYGVVYEPDKVDGHGDWSTAEEIEKACHKFMMNWQSVGVMHSKEVRDVKIVECYVAPADFKINGERVTKGTWVLVVKVLNDLIWEAVKKGELNGFSLQGHGREVKKKERSTR